MSEPLPQIIQPDTDIELRRLAWSRYVPVNVRYLLIGEAPPAEGRYFYFKSSTTNDHLFIQTMRAIYRELEDADAKEIRLQKGQLLERFKNDGFLLIDAVEKRIPTSMPERHRIKLIQASLPDLQKRISGLKGRFFSFAIKHSVYEALSPHNDGTLGILYNNPIPFPGNGHQVQFRDSLRRGISATRSTSMGEDLVITHLGD